MPKIPIKGAADGARPDFQLPLKTVIDKAVSGGTDLDAKDPLLKKRT